MKKKLTKAFVKEHKRLVKVLDSGTLAQRKAEAKKQKREIY